MPSVPHPSLADWVDRFDLHPMLREHVLAVLARSPRSLLDDLMTDPAFLMVDYDPGPGAVMRVPVGVPRPGAATRTVVFKRTLADSPAAFAQYVVAHELAHAHLRNSGDEHEAAERDADALAAAWGFPRPAHRW